MGEAQRATVPAASALETLVSFEVGAETLSGRLVQSGPQDAPRLLFLHGAGRATKERTRPLALVLAAAGIPSFAFDFSGHGGSTGTLAESSLRKRTEEAQAALQFCATNAPLTVCGFSMGAHIALRLLRHDQRIRNVLLFAPAVYDGAAFNVGFDDEFTRIIRRADSWRDTDVVEDLERFSGGLLIVIGDQDQVIPAGVIELLDACSFHLRAKRIIVVPGLSHALAAWISDTREATAYVAGVIGEFLAS